MSSDAPHTPDAVAQPFPSFAALRAAHLELMRSQRQQANPAEAQAFGQRVVLTGVYLDEDSEREGAQGILDYWNASLYRAGHSQGDWILLDFDPALAPELPDSACPYRGLSAFNENDSQVFFGRQKLIEEYTQHLAHKRLLVVSGPSGSGKSSLVRAGLLPALRQDPAGAAWNYLPPLVPGSQPLHSLAQTLGLSQENAARLAQQPEQVTNWLPNQPLVLVVDQFEEIFTLCDDLPTRSAFVRVLMALTISPTPHRVIITVRTDYEPRIQSLPEFQTQFEDHLLRLPPLSAADLRAAIEEPARQIGLKFDEGLVAALMNDILGEPAALPLLQFTLLKLWEGRDRNRVTWESYHQLGGGRLALSKTADQIYQNLIPEEQITARRIFLRLVRPSEGLEITSRRLRRRELFTAGEAGDRVERTLNKLLQARLLRLTRGQTAADDQIEVAHEALIRNWPSLVGWLEEERETIRRRQRLTNAAERWQELGRPKDNLLRGQDLEEAQRYTDLSDFERDFVQASLQERNDELARLRLQRNRLLTAVILASFLALAAVVLSVVANRAADFAISERAAAESARSSAEGARSIAETQQSLAEAASTEAIAQKSTAIAANTQIVRQQSTAVAANTQVALRQATAAAASTQVVIEQSVAQAENERAQVQTILAQARQLFDLARSLGSKQTDLGLLLGLQAVELDNTLAGQGVLLDVLNSNPQLSAYLRPHRAALVSAAYSPKGDFFVSGDSSGRIIVWQNAVPATEVALASSLGSLALHPSENLFAAGGCGAFDRSGGCIEGQISFYRFDASRSSVEVELLETRAAHAGLVSSLAFLPDGRFLASGGMDGSLVVWNSPTLAGADSSPLTTITEGGPITALAAGQEQTVAVANPAGEVHIHSLTALLTSGAFSSSRSSFVLLPPSPVVSLAFSPDGRFLAGGMQDSRIALWDITERSEVIPPLQGHTYPVQALAFSATGLLASGSKDGTAIIWRLSDGQRLSPQPASRQLYAHTESVQSVAFSPDGSQLLSGGGDQVLILWATSDQVPLATVFNQIGARILSLSFSHDKRILEVTRADQSYQSWLVEPALASAGADWQQVGRTQQLNPLLALFFASEHRLYGLEPPTKTSDILGLDVSEFNGAISWSRIAAQGYRFAYARATSGSARIDRRFSENWSGIQSAGLLRGAYHVLDPLADPATQAKFFLETSGITQADLPPALVVETPLSKDRTPSADVLRAMAEWLQTIEKATGIRPIIYISAAYWNTLQAETLLVQQTQFDHNLNRYPLWVANYSDASQPLLPQGWLTWTFWQYTDQASVAGITGKATVNRFNGNLDALTSLPALSGLTDPGSGDTPPPEQPSFQVVSIPSESALGTALPVASASAAAYYSTSQWVALGSQTGLISLWDLAAGKQINAFLVSDASIHALVFSPDGARLAAAGGDGLTLWDLTQTPPQPTRLVGHTGAVLSAAFSPDGRMLASGGADSGVILWDTQTFGAIGQPITSLRTAITSLAFSHDSSLLAAGGGDGRFALYDVQVESWRQRACQLSQRELSAAEQNQYLGSLPLQKTCP